MIYNASLSHFENLSSNVCTTLRDARPSYFLLLQNSIRVDQQDQEETINLHRYRYLYNHQCITWTDHLSSFLLKSQACSTLKIRNNQSMYPTEFIYRLPPPLSFLCNCSRRSSVVVVFYFGLNTIHRAISIVFLFINKAFRKTNYYFLYHNYWFPIIISTFCPIFIQITNLSLCKTAYGMDWLLVSFYNVQLHSDLQLLMEVIRVKTKNRYCIYCPRRLTMYKLTNTPLVYRE